MYIRLLSRKTCPANSLTLLHLLDLQLLPSVPYLAPVRETILLARLSYISTSRTSLVPTHFQRRHSFFLQGFYECPSFCCSQLGSCCNLECSTCKKVLSLMFAEKWNRIASCGRVDLQNLVGQQSVSQPSLQARQIWLLLQLPIPSILQPTYCSWLKYSVFVTYKTCNYYWCVLHVWDSVELIVMNLYRTGNCELIKQLEQWRQLTKRHSSFWL